MIVYFGSRWIQVRNGILAKSLGQRFGVFLKGYDYVWHAISAWWDSGKPCSKFTSTLFRSLIQKLTISDWSLLYEALGAAFSDRADHLASALLAQIENTRSVHIVDESQVSQSTGDQISLVGMPGIPLEDSAVEAQQHKSSVGKWRAWKSNGRKSVDELEFQELWQSVCTLWMRYKRWLMLIVSHCPELNHEVMAERARGYVLFLLPLYFLPNHPMPIRCLPSLPKFLKCPNFAQVDPGVGSMYVLEQIIAYFSKSTVTS